jgi:hypothetical protein
MSPKRKITVAALATALFVGGLTAAGIGMRSSTPQQAPASASAPAVVKQTRTRTVVEHVKPAGASSPPSIAQAAPAAAVAEAGSNAQTMAAPSGEQEKPPGEADDDQSGGSEPDHAGEHEFDD